MNLIDVTKKILDLERKATQDDSRKKRLKGAALCVASIEELQRDLYQVASRRGEGLYQVTLHWCQCDDNKYRNGQEVICAHREAVIAYAKAQKALGAFNALEQLQISV